MTRVVNIKHEPCDVVIMRPGRYGNPFVIGKHGTRAQCMLQYRHLLETDKQLQSDIQALRGKTLGCCCKPLDCHGDIIVEFLERKPNLLTW